MNTLHVLPVDDLVEHSRVEGDGCVCGPSTELVPNDAGPDGWLVVHHALEEPS